MYEVNSRWTIDGSPRSNVARYANHLQPERRQLTSSCAFIRALRNIKPGEEIVYDYGIDYLKNVIGARTAMLALPQAAQPARVELRAKRQRRAARLARERKAARALAAKRRRRLTSRG